MTVKKALRPRTRRPPRPRNQNNGVLEYCAKREIAPCVRVVDDPEEAVGFVVREKSYSSASRQSFAKGDGSHQADVEAGRQFQSIRRCAY